LPAIAMPSVIARRRHEVRLSRASGPVMARR
jgi:hypothetical protein